MFEWNEDFSVKVSLMDEQHKRLFEIGEELNNLLENDQGKDVFDKVMDAIIKLTKYTVYHFEEEEKLMAQCHYTDLENHKKEHRDFIAYLREFEVFEVAQNQIKVTKDLVEYIATWIFKHISNSDFKYSDCVNETL